MIVGNISTADTASAARRPNRILWAQRSRVRGFSELAEKGRPTAQEEGNLNEAVAGMQKYWNNDGAIAGGSDRLSSMPRTWLANTTGACFGYFHNRYQCRTIIISSGNSHSNTIERTTATTFAFRISCL